MVHFNVMRRQELPSPRCPQLMPPSELVQSYYDYIPDAINPDIFSEDEVAEALAEKWGGGHYYIFRADGRHIKCIFNRICRAPSLW
jgi:hypothetical protein